MNICMVSDDYYPATTGGGVHVHCISQEFAKRGHHVVVITSRRKGQPRFERQSGVHIYRVLSSKSFGYHLGVTKPSTVRQILVEHKINVVHFHHFSLLMAAGLRAARSLGLKTIVTHHTLPEQLTAHLHRIRWMSFKVVDRFVTHAIAKACNACDLVLVPSRRMVEAIRLNGVTAPIHHTLLPIRVPGAIA